MVAAAGGVAAGGRQLGGGAGVGVAAHPQHAALVTSRVTPLLAISILKTFKLLFCCLLLKGYVNILVEEYLFDKYYITKQSVMIIYCNTKI